MSTELISTGTSRPFLLVSNYESFMMVNLDNSEVSLSDVRLTGMNPFHIASLNVDVATGTIFWVDILSKRIMSVNITGMNHRVVSCLTFKTKSFADTLFCV